MTAVHSTLDLTVAITGASGAVFGREAVLIGVDGPEVLTTSPSWQA